MTSRIRAVVSAALPFSSRAGQAAACINTAYSRTDELEIINQRSRMILGAFTDERKAKLATFDTRQTIA